MSLARGGLILGQGGIRRTSRRPQRQVLSERLRLEAYQKLSAASSPASAEEQLGQVLEELGDRYGEPPGPVLRLIEVSRLRRLAQKAGLSEVVAMGGNLRVSGAGVTDSRQVRLQRMFPGSRYLAPTATVSVPLPRLHGEPVGDEELIAWTERLLVAVYGADAVVTGAGDA